MLLLSRCLLGLTVTLLVRVCQGDDSIAEVLPTGSVVSILRSVDTSVVSAITNRTCVFDGGRILLAGPSSLEQGDKYYFQCYRQRLGYQLVLDYVNVHRCGAKVNGKHYKLDLQTFDDQSSTELTEAIAHKLVKADNVDMMVAGYSSALTKPLSTVVTQHNANASEPRLLMCAGSALTSNFADRPYVFTTAPPVGKFLVPAFAGLAEHTDAKTVATIWEDVGFTTAACAVAPDLAAQYNFEIISQTQVPQTPNASVLEPVARNLSQINPDIVITCVYDCVPWNTAMRNVQWSPKAQVYTICVGGQDFREALGTDVEHVMGVAIWAESVRATDALTGWTTQEYSRRFQELSSDTVVVEAATLGSALISVAVQTMEATNTISNATVLANHLNTQTFPTMLGELQFDENGQGDYALTLLQNDRAWVAQTVFPPEKQSAHIVYPMPTWDGRDCVHVSDCERIYNYTCDTQSGMCICPQGYTSTGVGITAHCTADTLFATASANAWSSPGTIIGIVAAGLVAIAITVWAVMEQKKRKNDAVWKVDKQELKFEEPPVVVGRGTFGVVLLAEYRGTEVAVKRVIPPKKGGGSGKHSGVLTTSGMGTVSLTNGGDDQKLGSMSLSNGADDPKLLGSMSISNTNHLGSTSMGGGGGASKYTLGFGSTTKAERRKLEKDFISEMRYLSKLRHPCITTVMGAVIKKGEDPMLVMEYMEHGSLYDILHNNTMVLEGEILLPIIRDISSGLRFLHASNPQIIHGDLKAANILIDSKFRAKVADFGLSQKHSLGVAAGTPFWMAPELLRGTSVNTAATDMYAYGIILYEVFSRKDPYEGEDPKEVLKLVADPNIHKRPPVPKDCPPLIEGLMSDCLVQDPQERPTFEEVNMRVKRMDCSKVDNGASKDRATISLFDIFPRHIAEALRDGREVASEHKEMVTIFFCDIVGFTTISSTLEPKKVAHMLDRLYTKFDQLSHEHDIFKVETIGDAYMAVTNLVKDQPDDHTKRIANFAIDAIEAANDTRVDLDDPSKGYVNIRVGFHSGPVVADVVGSRNPRYCLFGDTVNTASRMESTSKENCIHCSEIAYKNLKKQDDTIKTYLRGMTEVKGKGKMKTYWIHTAGPESGEKRRSQRRHTEGPNTLPKALHRVSEVTEDNLSAAFLSEAFMDEPDSDDGSAAPPERAQVDIEAPPFSPQEQPQPQKPEGGLAGFIEKSSRLFRLGEEVYQDEVSV
ncbi:activated protein kinase catalytic subunit alpha-1 [Seminavis robusta]|uniref:Guanylate cyclase n=1 Tax=Seminavis robusta TaxID=568900 RepID=A0A9N8HJU3_9STRA|nr:activated protein kinase catalytic subunit alpha-1 [Seminavis robusta]|eukprot:Sro790_g202800.1 activated protein kinase catalytic subunit alpha-1 (1218) ;mRNA; r:17872-22385